MKVFVFIAFCLASSLAMPLSEDIFLVENEDGEQYYAIPVNTHSIQKRQSGAGIDGAGTLSLSHTGTLLNTDRHRLDGTATASRNINHHDTWSKGGQLDYSHKPSGGGLSLGAQNQRGYGTDVNAAGRYNFFQSPNGRTTAGVSAEYNRHFGGPGGAGRPSYGAFANFNHRF